MPKKRKVAQIVQAQTQLEGAGVAIQRTIGTQALRHFDPFLLLDWFGSDKPNEYIAGFPSHPHRGFITVTYMLDGSMQHEDSTGTKGVLNPGSVQWMKAARGIIHSEMPRQKEGLMRGFQLWLNLPASEKMSDPEYQEFDASKMPVMKNESQEVKVISGSYQGQQGPVKDDYTSVFYFDVHLKENSEFEMDTVSNTQVFLFVYKGKCSINGEIIASSQLATLTDGEKIHISAAGKDVRYIIVGGMPIGEPVVQAGPFVMNTKEEIMQAFSDYESGRLAL